MFKKEGKVLFNDGWQFLIREKATPLADVETEKDWHDVALPHDWLIGDTRDLYRSGEGWYKKTFTLSDGDVSGSVELMFGGVYMNSAVYVNGVKAGEWKYGYTSFSLDITALCKAGENIVYVSVLHEFSNSRWYSGAGIFRNVWLIKQRKTHIISDGVYIITRPAPNLWKIRIEAEYAGEADTLRYTMRDAGGNIIDTAESAGDYIFEYQNPELWTLRKPYLYAMTTELIKDGEVVDKVYNNFGFRTLRFSREQGFMLNERKLKLHGVCNHHDLGTLGAAFNINALRRQFMLLKSMGVNAIRTSHNPPAPEFIELCDEMGFLVVNEFSDMWELKKTDFDYARFFPEWYKKDVAAWVRRDRNHPCVIMWSIGNEIYDTHASERGLQVAKNLTEEVEMHDPYHNAAATIGSNYMEWEPAQKVADYLKIAGYNYGEQLYDGHYAKYEERFIYGSETTSTVRSRGIYHLPLDTPLLTHDDNQCSDLGNSVVGWGKSNESSWVADRDRGWCGGQFIWTGFDYIGEPTPYGTKNSYFGAIDTAGLPKASYWFYKAVWGDRNNDEKVPFVKIFPHWDWNEGQIIDVITYSNMEKVELFLNGESLGRQITDLMTDDILHAAWRVKYVKGELTAKAYDSDNGIAATDKIASFGEPVLLKAEFDDSPLYADGTGLKFITVSAYDEKGEFAANARNRVTVKVAGTARLVGFDNGDSTDYDSYKGDNRRLFSGRAVAVIQTGFEGGKAEVEISSKGLKGVKLDFDVLPCEKTVGVAAPTEHYPVYIQPYKDEIPARKIELKAQRRELDENNRSVEITARILPTNADYKEIEWKCVSDNGMETDIAEVIKTSGSANVTVAAKGDGGFRIRAFCRNGSDKDFPQIISELEMSASGLGEVTRSPYRFTSASLYKQSNKKLVIMGNGAIACANERAVIGFGLYDFGRNGTGKLILYIGNGNEKTLPVEIWLGDPDSGGELVLTAQFEDNRLWDNFKPQEFTLPKRLTGVKKLYFVINERSVFGGFEFGKDIFAKISASANDSVYGDRFEVSGDKIEKIGNNVFIKFNGLDFGEKGARRITVCGKTPNAVNSIHLRYGEKTQLLEFKQSADYAEQTFPLETIAGKQDIGFVFLPGSDFDFAWFKFEE